MGGMRFPVEFGAAARRDIAAHATAGY